MLITPEGWVTHASAGGPKAKGSPKGDAIALSRFRLMHDVPCLGMTLFLVIPHCLG